MRASNARLAARLISTEGGEKLYRSEVSGGSGLSPEAVDATHKAYYRPLEP
jgi:hypothetical protein